ncbi:MAG: FxsA family protein [Bdellovibrio sp.]|nr:FxsA family protein [Bdellovibrio sp.]
MLFIPFPLVLAEIFIFFFAVKQWGFLNTLGFYFLPCVLGFLIVSTVGRMAIMTLQGSVMKGQLPGNRLLHSGAIFFSGLLFMVPSFFARLVALVLFLPGLRHIFVAWFKIFIAKKIAKGSGGFSFGGGPFGFGAGNAGGAGFRYYQYRGAGFEGADSEREVSETNVLDVTPLKVTHEKKDGDETN